MKKTVIESYAEKRATMPLLSWDIFSQFSTSYFRSISEKNSDRNELTYFAHTFKWKNKVSDILRNNEYEALVLTDYSKKILWVNEGFTKMTGYSKQYAKNKRPSFLQGKNSNEKRMSIRKKLASNRPFKEVIVNYRKDGTPYDCELHIFPLISENSIHYLALERAV